MRLVVIESPYAGDVARNVRYARLCALDCLRRGESPYASHLLFPQFLDDSLPDERKLGIEAGLAWGAVASLRAVYCDLGMSAGMSFGVDAALRLGQTVEVRTLPPDLMQKLEV